MTLFRRTYRSESARLPGWDYRASGYYFVTICTKRRESYFGEVTDGEMRLSPSGEIVAAEWNSIAARRRDLELDEWIIMPNHIHAIVVLKAATAVETPQSERSGIRQSKDTALAHRDFPEQNQRGVSTSSRLLASSLGAIIGQFKSRATRGIWRAGFRDFGWQERFYDHIIRDAHSLAAIRQYIIDNPLKWELDQDNAENLYM